MNKKVTKQTLRTGTAVIWGAVLIGVSIFVQAADNKALDWQIMWVVIGGFLLQNILINAYFRNDKK